SVLLFNAGKLLYDGPPRQLTRRVEGRTFLVQGTGKRRRPVLAKALKQPQVLDGVIQGRNIRLVLRAGAIPPEADALGAPSAQIAATPPRFEDAFVDLLRAGSGRESRLPPSAARARSSELPARPPIATPAAGRAAEPGDAVVDARALTKRFGDFAAVDQIS